VAFLVAFLAIVFVQEWKCPQRDAYDPDDGGGFATPDEAALAWFRATLASSVFALIDPRPRV
jgi:hypothetical protein